MSNRPYGRRVVEGLAEEISYIVIEILRRYANGSTAIFSPKILADEILFATFVILAWMSHSATRLT